MYLTIRILLVSLAFTTLAVAGFAQGQTLSIEYFDEDNGLNITALNDIFQDREGFLWLATREGLVRFDGHSFRYFRNVPGDSTSIFSNNVLFITEDRGGDIWAGLVRGGVSRYDRKTGKFRNYNFTEKLKIKAASVVRIFFDKDGEIWLGVGGYGIVHLDQKTDDFKAYDLVTAQNAPFVIPEELPSFNTPFNFWQDEHGKIWCATSADLYEFDPKTGQAVSHRSEIIEVGGFNSVQAYALCPDGDLLWVGGWSSGLRCYNRKTGAWKKYLFDLNPAQPDAVNIVNTIAQKTADELWVSSFDKGLGIFNKKTEKFFFFSDDSNNYPELPVKAIDDLYVDSQGNIWLNHKHRLLRIQLKDRHFHFHPVQSKLPTQQEGDFVSVVLDDREGQFRLTGLLLGGLQVLDKKNGKTTYPDFKNQPGISEGNTTVRDILQAHDGTFWILARHILYRFNAQTMLLEIPPQPPVFSPEIGSNYYNQMTEDAQGNIWMSSAIYGIYRYNTRTGETTHFMPDGKTKGGIPTNVVGPISCDGKGRVWYGSRDKTAYGYFSADKNRFVYLDANGEVTHELASLRLNSFFTDRKGDIWAGTEQGLMHFDCSGDQPRLVKKYTIADGLSSDYVIWGVEDDQGKIWVTPATGLCRLDVAKGQFTFFGKQDGIPAPMGFLGKMGDGSLYTTANNGYYTFASDSLTPARNEAPVVLTSFKVNDEEQYPGSERRLEAPLVVLSKGRYFSLEFAALDLAHPELSQYEYQLEGLDDQWVKAGSRHIVNYTNVPAGRYLFKVKLEGTPESEALAVPLVVQVAFYKTGLFWAFVLVALIALAFFYLRNRQRQKQHVTELRSKTQMLEKEKALVQYESLKQQLNPHFLFNSLTSLGSLITIDPKAAIGFLDSLSKTYRYILKSSEREVVPLIEELKFGESFVKLQKTRFGEGFQVNFKIGEADFHRKIVPVTLQNLIENAIKHNIIDEEEPLVIDVTVEGGYLVVRNNLQKKKFVETSNKRGLTNLQSFYRYLSEKPIVVEENERFFTIKIPLL